MFSIFYLSVFQLVASELFPAAFDGEPLADPNFGAFFYNPTNFAVHYALEAKNEAVNAVQAATSTSRGLQDSAAAAMEMCSSWESLGNIVGRPEISNGVYCQVGPKAAEGNEWKKCVDGTTKPAPPAITYTGLCPGSWSAPSKDRSLQDSPDAAIARCSSWKPQGFVEGSPLVPIGGVWCQVGISAAQVNFWFACADGVTKPTGDSLLEVGICPSGVSRMTRSLQDRSDLFDFPDIARSLQDSPAAAMNQCSSWKSLGNIVGPPGFSPHGVYCQVGPKAAEGNEWKECVDGTTKPAPPAIIYTGLCPGTMPEEVGDIHI